MSQTHDVGPFYLHTMPYPKKAPRVERAFTHEIEEPYRLGKGICLRFGQTAVIIGKWGEPDMVDAAYTLNELEAEPIMATTEEIREWPKV